MHLVSSWANIFPSASVSANHCCHTGTNNNYYHSLGSLARLVRSDYELRHISLFVCPSLRPQVKSRLQLEGFLRKFVRLVEDFSKICRVISSFFKNLTRITGTIPADGGVFVISRWIFLRMRNVSDRSFRQNQITHFMFNEVFFFSKIVPFMR